MKIFIKNMVSERCKTVVRNELARLHISCNAIELGVAHIPGAITDNQKAMLNKALEVSGLALIADKKHVLIEKLKNAIIHLVHYSEEEPRANLSIYLSEKLRYDYTYLANTFSAAEGTTLEKFMIAHKIERVKELLTYGDLTLTEIASILHYSSVSHLSNQFKKTTGYAPSVFKKQRNKRRISLDDV